MINNDNIFINIFINDLKEKNFLSIKIRYKIYRVYFMDILCDINLVYLFLLRLMCILKCIIY